MPISSASSSVDFMARSPLSSGSIAYRPDSHLMEHVKRVAQETLGVNEAAQLTVEGRNWIATKDADGRIYIGTISGNLDPVKESGETERGFLGAGGFGIVYELFDPEHGEMAVKISRQVGGREAHSTNKQLFREAKILKRLHSDGLVPGIVPPPHAVFTIPTLGPSTAAGLSPFPIVGYWRRSINGCNAARFVENGYQIPGMHSRATCFQLLKMVGTLLDVVAYLEQRQVKHGDIKLPNLMIENDDQGNPSIFLTDFGGAVSYDKGWRAFPEKAIGTHTHRYCHSTDLVALQSLQEKVQAVLNHEPQDSAELDRLKEEWVTLVRGMDRFALGFSIVSLLTRRAPQAIGGCYYASDSLYSQYGTAIGLAIMGLLSHEPEKRSNPFVIKQIIAEHTKEALVRTSLQKMRERIAISYSAREEMERLLTNLPICECKIGELGEPPSLHIAYRNAKGLPIILPILQKEDDVGVEVDGEFRTIDAYVEGIISDLPQMFFQTEPWAVRLTRNVAHWFALPSDDQNDHLVIQAVNGSETKMYYAKYTSDVIEDKEVYFITLYDQKGNQHPEADRYHSLDDLGRHPWLAQLTPFKKR